MAKTSPNEFIRQVDAERKKISWPTSRETMMTAVMVVLLTGTLGIFFFALDSMFGWIVKMLLGMATGQS